MQVRKPFYSIRFIHENTKLIISPIMLTNTSLSVLMTFFIMVSVAKVNKGLFMGTSTNKGKEIGCTWYTNLGFKINAEVNQSAIELVGPKQKTLNGT